MSAVAESVKRRNDYKENKQQQRPVFAVYRDQVFYQWTDIQLYCHNLGVRELCWEAGFYPPFIKAKRKAQKKYPELNALIEDICGKDRYVEYIKAQERRNRNRMLILIAMLSALIAIAVFVPNPEQTPFPICTFIIGFLSIYFQKIDYHDYGFSDEEAQYFDIDDDLDF